MSEYISVSEFKQAPTGIDCTTLDQTNLGNQAAQDISLQNVIRAASAWIDNYCQVNTLEATQITELKEVRIGRDGRLTVHVDNTPIINIQSIQYRTYPVDPWMAVGIENVQAYDNWFSIYHLPMLSNNYYGLNIREPLSTAYFNVPYRRQLAGDIPITMQYVYTNGYANTKLALDANAGDTAVTVADPTGITVGLKMNIYDGGTEETVFVQSITGNVVTLNTPLLFAHSQNTPLSAIPMAVKQACLLVASYMIKERGSLALTMNETVVSGTSMGYNKSSDLELAKELLRPYVRVVVS